MDKGFWAGIYRHYKGHLYQVLGLARDANDSNRIAVVYIGLDLNGARPGVRMMFRDKDEFFAVVCTNRNHPCYGKSENNWLNVSTHILQRRFEYQGLALTEDMLK